MDKKLDFIFAEDPSKLLIDIRSHLKQENLEPLSLDIIKEHNNFCAVVVSKKIEDKFIG